MQTALDPDFDEAVIAMAKRRWPQGFDIGDDAPATYDALVAHVEGGNRMKVWDGASNHTVFARPEVNHAFRAWHDFHHVEQREHFTLAGEAAVAEAMIDDLRQHYGTHPRFREWCAYIYAEFVGQGLCARLNADVFPEDQRRFVETFSEVILDPHPVVSKGGGAGAAIRITVSVSGPNCSLVLNGVPVSGPIIEGDVA